MKFNKETSIEQHTCLWCDKKIKVGEVCFKAENGSYLCYEHGLEFKKIAEQSKLEKFDRSQKSIADFTKQEEDKRKFEKKKRFIYSVPVRNFTAIKDVYKDSNGNRIEVEREI